MKTILNRISQWLFGREKTQPVAKQEALLMVEVKTKETILVPLFSTPTPFQKGIA